MCASRGAGEDEGGVVAAEGEVGGHGGAEGFARGVIADEGEIEGGVGGEGAGVGGGDVFAEGLGAEDGFDGAPGGAREVWPVEPLGGADEWEGVGEAGADGTGFHGVVVAGAGAVGVEVVDLVGESAAARASASCMARVACRASGSGAVMWWASQVMPKPRM